MGRLLAAAFPGALIKMATDMKGAAQAEARWGALAGYNPAIYLNLQDGTGRRADHRRPGRWAAATAR